MVPPGSTGVSPAGLLAFGAFSFSEEPELVRRLGEEYIERYVENRCEAPMFIPGRRPGGRPKENGLCEADPGALDCGPSMHVIRLTPAHAAEYRAIMLEAYADEAEAFTATVAEREPLPLEWWASRLSEDPDSAELVFGALAGARLAGVAGLRFERRQRTRHKASLFGMAVRPPFRGQGIARALVEAVLGHARSEPGTRVVQLTVTQSNAPALRLYEACGFLPFGTEPFAIQLGARFISLVHMWCDVA